MDIVLALTAYEPLAWYLFSTPVLLFVAARNVEDITLAYTFYKVDEDEDATASQESSDNQPSGVKLHGSSGGYQLPLPGRGVIAPSTGTTVAASTTVAGA
eukprot:jgi/Chrzof1/14757/Cz09g15030.t1